MVSQTNSRVVLMTGDGKGKTTSALGMVLRAAGHNLRICVIHFIKDRRDTGEMRALSSLPGVETHLCGEGFYRPRGEAATKKHRQAAEAGLAFARQRLTNPECDMVVLDEVCGAVALGLIEVQALCEAVRSATPGKIVVLTGRDACPQLMALADTVSRIECVKHGMSSGWPAQKGVEW